MKSDFAYNNITGHVPKSKDLPDLDWNLAGISTILDHVREHLPNAKPAFESIPSDGLSVRIIR